VTAVLPSPSITVELPSPLVTVEFPLPLVVVEFLLPLVTVEFPLPLVVVEFLLPLVTAVLPPWWTGPEKTNDARRAHSASEAAIRPPIATSNLVVESKKSRIRPIGDCAPLLPAAWPAGVSWSLRPSTVTALPHAAGDSSADFSHQVFVLVIRCPLPYVLSGCATWLMSGPAVTAVDFDYGGMATAGSRVRQMTHLVCLPGPRTQPTPDWALLTVRDAGTYGFPSGATDGVIKRVITRSAVSSAGLKVPRGELAVI
jgi:hypothetical protein